MHCLWMWRQHYWSLVAMVHNLFQCLSDLAVVSPRYNAICTITVAAFRRLLRQEGAFFHQTPNDTKPICWWIDALLSAVSQDAPQELEVPFFRSISMPSRCKINTDALAQIKVLPVDIDTMHLPNCLLTAARWLPW